MIDSQEVPQAKETLALSEINSLRLKLKMDEEFRKEFFNDEDFRKAVAPYTEVLDWGTESVIVVDPQDEKKVIGIGYHDRGFNTGIMPFTETRFLHEIINTLFPKNFPKVYKIENMGARDTLRERVFGETATWSGSDANIYDRVENKLQYLGIRVISDPFSRNYMKNTDGHIKYVDLLQGAESIKQIDVEKTKQFFMSTHGISAKNIDSDRSWKTLSYQIRKLKELILANKIFSDMSASGKYDLNDKRVQDQIEGFHFTKDQDENSRSKNDIRRLLTRAIKAVNEEGHVFKDHKWVK
jgi:hypothetical protein